MPGSSGLNVPKLIRTNTPDPANTKPNSVLIRNNTEYFNPIVDFLDPQLVNEEFRVVEINVEDYLNDE